MKDQNADVATLNDLVTRLFTTGMDAFHRGDLQTAENNLGVLANMHSVIAQSLLFRGFTLARGGLAELAADNLGKAAAMDAHCENQIIHRGFHDYLPKYFGRVAKATPDMAQESETSKHRWPVTRWPVHGAIADIKQMGQVVTDHLIAHFAGADKFIRPDFSFVTMGSCFARNIGRALTGKGYQVYNTELVEEATNSYALKYFFEWIAGTADDKFTAMFEALLGAEERESLAHAVRSADCMILTFGVAPGLFHEASGEFAFTNRHRDKTNFAYLEGDYALRTTSVAENVDNIRRILDIVRLLNPSCRMVMSVSPVPLTATDEMPSVIIADCVSKATIRLAVHEITAARPEIVYWPSFEMFRWLSGHADFKVFGSDDGVGRHTNRDMVDLAIGLFIDSFAAQG